MGRPAPANNAYEQGLRGQDHEERCCECIMKKGSITFSHGRSRVLHGKSFWRLFDDIVNAGRYAKDGADILNCSIIPRLMKRV